MLGVINLDKPVGPTSHDMVALVRRLTGMRRIGHAGTLDPLASGVLPILVGAATRLSEELTGGRKRYEAVIRLGYRSRTDDGEGPIEVVAAPPPVEVVTAGLEQFVGTFPQRPPAFSARKQAGQTGHRAARRGEAIDLPPREVTVHELRVLETAAEDGWLDVRLELETSPGTYVRSLARDLGERLGCGGYLFALRRTEAAGLKVEDGWTPERLAAAAADDRLTDALIPVDRLVPLPQVELDAVQCRRFTNGLATPWPGDGTVLVRGPGGLLGVGALEGGQLRPRKVLVE